MKDLTETTQSLVSSAEAFLYGVSRPRRRPARPRSGQAARHLHAARGDRLAFGADHHPAGQARRLLRPQGDVHAAGRAAARGRHHAADHRRRHRAAADRDGHRAGPVLGLPRRHQPVRLHAGELRRHRPLADHRQGAPVDASISVDFLDEGPLATSSPVEALRAFTRSWRFQQCFARQLFRFYIGPRRDRRRRSGAAPDVLDFANGERRTSSPCCARWRARRPSPDARRCRDDARDARAGSRAAI